MVVRLCAKALGFAVCESPIDVRPALYGLLPREIQECQWWCGTCLQEGRSVQYRTEVDYCQLYMSRVVSQYLDAARVHKEQ